MKRSLMCACLVLATASPTRAQDADKMEWVQLFNGKDLKGWVPKFTGFAAGVNYNDTFRVGNGLLRVAYDKYDAFGGHFGHLFYEKAYSHYVVAVEYRFVGQQVKDGPDWGFRNNGVMVHGQAVETMGKDQDFPISLEAQLLGGRGDGTARSTANLCTPGTNVVMNGQLETRHCIGSSSKTFDGDQWVRVEVEVHGGDEIVHKVNGEVVLRYQKPQIGGGNVSGFDPAVKKDGEILTSGSISLQAESHPTEFRKVELLNLVGCRDKKAKNYKSYYEQDDAKACKY
jgi:hypothetical protein